jgi:DNA-binding beta-propeller fold protein YncE
VFGPGSCRRSLLGVFFCILAVSASTIAAGSAAAAVPPFLTRFGEVGTGAGQISQAGPLATDPVNGRVYVGDGANNRVSVFSPWGDFRMAFGWGVVNGAAELQSCGPKATPPTTTCRSGLAGGGRGELTEPWAGIGVDSSGNVYVAERATNRVQKFSPEGKFTLMFGGDVNKTKVEEAGSSEAARNLCTAASGDVCQAGSAGGGSGQFKELLGIAITAAGTVYVGDTDRIEVFNTEGVYQTQFGLPEEGEVKGGTPEGKGHPSGLAVDPAGSLYFDFLQNDAMETPEHPNIYKHTASGWSLFAETPFAKILTIDQTGTVYAIKGGLEARGGNREVIAFDAGGNPTIPPGSEFGTPEGGTFLESAHLMSIATNSVGDIYMAIFKPSTPFDNYITAYGPGPVALEPPPVVPPSVGEEYATSVDLDGAVVRAGINPHYWADTTYYVQYGTEDCEAGGCMEQPAPPGAPLGAGAINQEATSSGVFLADLLPHTTYHYRFVAQSSGGGPVYGADRTFTTLSPPAPGNTACANQGFRAAAAAFLPDCRAYELVSPLEKNNGDIFSLFNITGFPDALDQSSVDGDAFTYSTYQAFANAEAAPYTSQYLARREAGGWSSRALAPPRATSILGTTFDNEFKAFSPDLEKAWLVHESAPLLAPGAVAGFANLYRRENATGAYEALTRTAPPDTPPIDFNIDLQGVSADGSRAIFRAEGKLTPEAPELEFQHPVLYEATAGGQLRLVAILPDGSPSPKASSAGTPIDFGIDYRGAVHHALSADGSRVYWSESAAGAGPGPLYLRENADREQSAVQAGECTEPEKACTIEVSGAVSPKRARFWDASPDGSVAIFTIPFETGNAGNLYRFEADSGEASLLAPKVIGVLGAGEDATRLFFASEARIGGQGTLGKPNLYFYEEGETRFVGTLSSTDVNSIPSNTDPSPALHVARVSADGRQVAFISTASLSGYDNTDADTHKADTEVYVYDAAAAGGAGRLSCVSCLPSGARPAGREIEVGASSFPLAAAAILPGWENQLYPSRALSADGQRLFFNSFVSLLPRDTNGRTDVYEWEAPGSGDCATESPTYSPPNGGCLGLISSGESPADSEFLESSPSGGDVFFATFSSLLAQDPGLRDIYDARVGGGFPAPAAAPAACEGEACQSPPEAPNDPTPGSSSFQGAGNVVEKAGHKKRAKHRKHKHKRHAKRHRSSKHNDGGKR